MDEVVKNKGHSLATVNHINNIRKRQTYALNADMRFVHS